MTCFSRPLNDSDGCFILCCKVLHLAYHSGFFPPQHVPSPSTPQVIPPDDLPELGHPV